MNKEIKPQIAVVNNYTLIAALYTITFSILYYFNKKTYLALIHFIAFIGVLLNYFLLHFTKNYTRATNIILSIGTVVVTSLFATGGYENTGHFWIYVYLPFIFFQANNIKNTFFWVFVLYMAFLIAAALHLFNLIILPYSTPFLLNYFTSLFTLTILIFLFQQAIIRHETALSYTRSLIETSNDSFMVIDSDGKITDVNQVTLRLTGLTHNQLLNKHFSSIFTDIYKAGEACSQFFSSGFIHNFPLTILSTHGKTTEVLVSATSDVDNFGKIKGGFISTRDITDRIETEKKIKEQVNKLEKNNKELDQFAYIVSHDLRAPLRAISSLSGWIKEDLGNNLSEENKKNMDLLESRVQRMDSLINGILEYSKIGRMKVSAETVNVNDLLDEIVDLLSPPSKFTVIVQSEMPTLVTEKILLQQVFSNLINNAIKYNDKPEGKIDISVAPSENFYEFTVADNGPGIAPEHHDKIFGIFQTLTSQDKVDSTGIGLSIVQRIIEEHGGKVWIDSEKDSGAKFIFTWPRGNSNSSIIIT